MARLTELGSLDIDAAQLNTDPVWLAAGRLATTTAANTLTVVRLEPGLPVVSSTVFPVGMALPRAPWDNYDLNYDRVGIHGLALRPDGAAFAIGGVTSDHDRAVHVFSVEPGSAGKILAAAKPIAAPGLVDDDFMLCPIALSWGASGRTLLMCCSIENEHHLVSLDPAQRLKVTGLLNLGGDFPEPAAVFPACSSDRRRGGLPDRVRTGRRVAARRRAWRCRAGADRHRARRESRHHLAVRLRRGRLHALHRRPRHRSRRARAGAYHARAWPRLEVGDPVAIDGWCSGGAVLRDHLAIVVASDVPIDQWPRPEELVLHRLDDSAVAARIPFPAGHYLVAAAGNCIVTRSHNRITAWTVEE